MYNELLKQEFIDQFDGNESKQQNLLWLFNATESFEKIWKADICTRGGEDLQKIADHLFGFRNAAMGSRRRLLKEYLNWCVDKGVPGAKNDIGSVNMASTEKMRARTVSSPMHLQMYLNALFLDEKLLTRDNAVRAYCWLAYMGMPEEEILEVRCDEVNIENRIVTHNGAEYRIYPEAVPCLRNCKELDHFVCIHPLYPDKTSVRKRASGDLLLRVTAPEVSCKVFRHDMSVASRKLADKKGDSAKTKEERLINRAETLRLTYYRIWISGLFYRAYLAEGFNVEPDFTEAAVRFAASERITYSGKNYNKDTVVRKEKNNYLKDYMIWKKAYYS